MKKYKIKIILKSYLLCSNSNAGANLDAQPTFDEMGFPYLPGKTFKGLLRESMMEVLEILNESGIERNVDQYFGAAKNQQNGEVISAKIKHIDNFYLPQYSTILSSIKGKKIKKLQMQQYYTAKVQQTALDEGGIADDGSLRSFAVLDNLKAPEFEAVISVGEQSDLLEKAIKNIRYAGLGRNRGFGKVKCTYEVMDDEDIIPVVIENIPTNTQALELTIETLEPVIISTQKANENTVSTQNYISGSQVLGIFAWAHKDKSGSIFKDLFLNNLLKFDHCLPAGSEPFPLAIHAKKYTPIYQKSYHNILAESGLITKSVSGFYKKTNEQKWKATTVEKTLNFHSTRITDRAAGRSTKKEDNSTDITTNGGIYYYESVNKGQLFKGKISGSSALLQALVDINGLSFEARLGKSKSTQYGKVKITLSPTQSGVETNTFSGEVYLVAQSPLVFLNECGFPEATIPTMQSYLGTELIVKKAAVKTQMIEHYNAIWGVKTGKIIAFGAGSTFKIEHTAPQEMLVENYIGEMQSKGFGKVKYMTYAELDDYKNIEANEFISENYQVWPELESLLKQEQEKIGHKKKAFEDAQKSIYKRVNKSLCSRMIAVLNGVNSKAEIVDFYKHIKEKPAGTQLKDAQLWDDLQPDNDVALDKYKVRWIAFFTALRKLKKDE